MRKIATAWLAGLCAVFALTGICTSAQAVTLKVMTSGGFAKPLDKILGDFQRTSGISVAITIGKSQGSGDDTISAQLGRGVPSDMVILTREGMNDLIAGKKIVPHSDSNVAKSALGVAIGAGKPRPDISTVDAFKETLLNAKSVTYPSSTTGFYVTGKLLPKLGIAAQVLPKTANTGVAAVASGKSEIAIQAVTELIHVPGADFIGLVPKPLQYDTVFSTGLVKGTQNAAAARQLTAFLESKQAMQVLRDSGMEPVAH